MTIKNKTNSNSNSKTKRHIKTKTYLEKGGNILASGGFGCVFSPALKCKGKKKRGKNQISKLMTEKHAHSEYEEIVHIKEKLQHVKDYTDYYLIYDVSICKPAPLSKTDLDNYTSKCRALPKDKIIKTNINKNLDKLYALNMPYGGLPVDDYIYKNGSFEKMYKVHTHLIKLLKKGILPMNEKHIFHSDIKDSNVLIDSADKTRLVDWGLSVEYLPFKNHTFPFSWRNRPFQFNVPFSVILFSDSFVEKYSAFLRNKGKPTKDELKPFVIQYITDWMQQRGAGHYKFINEIMFELFSHESLSSPSLSSTSLSSPSLSSTSLSSTSLKPETIETQITMPLIVNYIVDVLEHYTTSDHNVKKSLRNYLDKVFIKIIDIWGFISVYYVFIEILSHNYNKLTKQEVELFQKLKYIFLEYLYHPRHEPISMNELYSDLEKISELIQAILHTIPNAQGKTRKHPFSKKMVSFKRRPKQKRFQHPFFLKK
jgi:serine/threonine protein kinase